jgi:tryptophan synthase beta chain
MSQLAMIGEVPDTIVAAVGAGSHFGGLVFPFYRESLARGRKPDLIAAEPAACPKLTRGTYTWDYHDALGSMPMSKMYTLGHDYVPPPVHAGGLRYHGAAPSISWMYHEGLISAKAYTQHETFEAGTVFAQAEQIIPAPESAHAVKCVIDDATKARETGDAKVILFCLSGHGLMDLGAYGEYLSGNMAPDSDPGEEINASLRKLGALGVLE